VLVLLVAVDYGEEGSDHVLLAHQDTTVNNVFQMTTGQDTLSSPVKSFLVLALYCCKILIMLVLLDHSLVLALTCMGLFLILVCMKTFCLA